MGADLRVGDPAASFFGVAQCGNGAGDSFCPDFFYFQLAFYVYTLLIFTGLLFHHQEISFRELGVIYSMSLLIPWALRTLVSIRNLDNQGHGMFYVIITIAAAWMADAGEHAI